MSTPLRTFVNDLLHDDAARAAFADDPASYLDDHGWSDLDGPDVGTALGALVEELPIDQAIRLHPVAVEADQLGADGLGAVAGLEAAAAAFSGSDEPTPVDPPDDPATTLDDDRSGDGAAQSDRADDDDDPSNGIDGDGGDDGDAASNGHDPDTDGPDDDDGAVTELDEIAVTDSDGAGADADDAAEGGVDADAAEATDEPSLFDDPLDQLDEAWSSESTDGFAEGDDELPTSDHDEVEDG